MMAQQPRKIEHKQISGPEFVSRFLVIEALVIALGRKYVADHPVGERDTLLESLRVAATLELEETGHTIAIDQGKRHLEALLSEISGEGHIRGEN
jgi:hypothetical protein